MTKEDHSGEMCSSSLMPLVKHGKRKHIKLLSNINCFSFYPCMLKKCGMNQGSVSADCACLPTDCYNNYGTNCDWYTICFGEHLNCWADKSGFAYVTSVCTLYQQNEQILPDADISWVERSRSNLCEDKLIRHIRWSKNITKCEHMKTLDAEI